MKLDNTNVTATGVASIRIPKNVAKITICGVFGLMVTDVMDFNLPTEEQRKNLKEMLCIDVEVLD